MTETFKNGDIVIISTNGGQIDYNYIGPDPANKGYSIVTRCVGGGDPVRVTTKYMKKKEYVALIKQEEFAQWEVYPFFGRPLSVPEMKGKLESAGVFEYRVVPI